MHTKQLDTFFISILHLSFHFVFVLSASNLHFPNGGSSCLNHSRVVQPTHASNGVLTGSGRYKFHCREKWRRRIKKESVLPSSKSPSLTGNTGEDGVPVYIQGVTALRNQDTKIKSLYSVTVEKINRLL